MNCKSAITPAEINHKLGFDVDGEDVDATTFKQLVGWRRYMRNTMPNQKSFMILLKLLENLFTLK